MRAREGEGRGPCADARAGCARSGEREGARFGWEDVCVVLKRVGEARVREAAKERRLGEEEVRRGLNARGEATPANEIQ